MQRQYLSSIIIEPDIILNIRGGACEKSVHLVM